jgi:hypothetical protein
MLAVGSIVLVGLREWEGPDNYKTCDVLEVYDQEDINQLRSMPATNIQQLDRFVQGDVKQQSSSSDELIFSDDADTSMVTSQVSKQKVPVGRMDDIDEGTDDDIDIDDI